MSTQTNVVGGAEPLDDALRLNLDEFSGKKAPSVLDQFRLPEPFYSAEVSHPVFDDAVKTIMGIMGQKETIILCAGPTGAGKTHLRRFLLRAILNEHREEMIKDRGFCPVIDMNAPVSNTTQYMWAPLFRDAFAAMGSPLPATRYARVPSGNRVMIGNQDYEALKSMFVATLVRRRCLLVILDEAQQLLGDRQDLERNLNMLKCLAEQTKVVWLLLGTYRQLEMLGQLSELVRRTAAINLPRYNITNGQAERDAFRGLLTRMTELAQMPGLREVTTNRAKLLYTGSFGIFGFLRRWIIGACARAKVAGRSVTVADFEATGWRSADMLRLLDDIEKGEKLFADTMASRTELERRLGIGGMDDGPGFLSSLANRPAEPTRNTDEEPGPPAFVEGFETRERKPFPKPLIFRKSLGMEEIAR